MKYVSLDEITEDLLKHFKNQDLYPIIGAGFTTGCEALSGTTPSGEDLKKEMINQIRRCEGEENVDLSSLSLLDLKTISKYYKKIVPRNIRTTYLLNNFTQVILPEYSSQFLKINWKYIYTFNIDTGIEDNSEYKNVILPNKIGDAKNIAKMKHCLYKIHGDVFDYCKYEDSLCYIFDQKEYAKSIKENGFMLNKINHDFKYNNLLFVGCGLDDEVDLLSLSAIDDKFFQTARYYVTNIKPDKFKEMDLEEYGITHVILVDDFKKFYLQIYKIFLDSQKVNSDDLDGFCNLNLNFIKQKYENNIDYLYIGKTLYDSKKCSLSIPNFFIDRSLVKERIIPEMSSYNLQFVCGGRVSGKTYLLLSIAKIIRDRDVYFFDSRYNLNFETLERLLHKKNVIVCFDTTSISKDQIYFVKENIDLLATNGNNFVVCINRSDKNIISAIKRSSDVNRIYLYDLENKFDEIETKELNQKLSVLTIPQFDERKTILDNLLIISEIVALPYNKKKFKYEANDIYSMSVLILLAIQGKIMSQEFVDFGIEHEVYDILRKLSPVVDEDYTEIIERDSVNASSCKIYINSKYWLLDKLGNYAEDSSKHSLIISAYHNIIERLLKKYGNNYQYNYIEEYIKYDVINEIFFRPVRGNLSLIKALYDNLNDLLYSNPQFYHQRAKCYLWHCDYSEDRKKEIKEALRFAKLAKHNLELSSNLENVKVIISLAHIDFTLALIYAKMNAIYEYENATVFKEGIGVIKEAIANPFNEEYFLGLFERKNKKIDDINRLADYIMIKGIGSFGLNTIERKQCEELVNRVLEMRMNKNRIF